jgi:NTE family protein
MASPSAVLRAAARPWTLRPGVLAAAVLPAGTRPTAMITEGLDPLFGGTWPKRPLWLPAVDLDDGRRVVFGQEGAPVATVGQAVAASCAIPGFFSPVEIGGRRYVDGGAHSTTNLDLVRGRGLDLVIVSVPMGAAGGGLSISADVGLRRFVRAQVQREAAGVRRRGTEVVAFQPLAADLTVMGINAMDFRRRAAVVEQVTKSVRQRLGRNDPRFRLLRTPPP